MLKDRILRVVFRIAGVFLLFFGVLMIATGIGDYIDQCGQADWVIIGAEVIDVQSEYSGRRAHRRAVYDITYQYEAEGEAYTGKIYSQSEPLSRGESVTVKYDPENPGSSTYIMSPYVGGLILFLAIGVVLIAAGIFMSGLWALVRRIRRRGMPEEEEYLPPEEYVGGGSLNRSRKMPASSVIGMVIIVGILACIMIVSLRDDSKVRAIDTREFMAMMEAEGYAATVTTERLKEEWKLGSALEEAVSFDDGGIRIDFCLMQTENDAVRLYDGMTLPVYDGEKQERGSGRYELCYTENETMYVAKIRVWDTVVYAAARVEYKDDVMGIMEKIGYLAE